MQAPVYNLTGKKVDTVEVPDEVFNQQWNPTLVHQALSAQQANRRKPLAHAKGRSEVRGGGRKPWRQKGTGRARHGSIRSPIWRGGGVTHGPTSERQFSVKINKKMKRLAINSLLSKKFADSELRFVDSLTISEAKTKQLDAALKAFHEKPKDSKKLSSLLVPAIAGRTNINRAARNLPNVKSAGITSLNVEDLLRYKHVLVDQAAVEELQKQS